MKLILVFILKLLAKIDKMTKIDFFIIAYFY